MFWRTGIMCRTVLSVLFFILINVTLNFALTYVTVGRYRFKRSTILIHFIQYGVYASSINSIFIWYEMQSAFALSNSIRLKKLKIMEEIDAFSSVQTNWGTREEAHKNEVKKRKYIFSIGKTSMYWAWIISWAHESAAACALSVCEWEREKFFLLVFSVQRPCVGRSIRWRSVLTFQNKNTKSLPEIYLFHKASR